MSDTPYSPGPSAQSHLLAHIATEAARQTFKTSLVESTASAPQNVLTLAILIREQHRNDSTACDVNRTTEALNEALIALIANCFTLALKANGFL